MTSADPCRGFRFSAEVIERAVWLCHCLSLSLRSVGMMLAFRSVVMSCENIRNWSLRFGRLFSKILKQRRPKPSDRWHLDEAFIRTHRKLLGLWHAVDQHGNVLETLV